MLNFSVCVLNVIQVKLIGYLDLKLMYLMKTFIETTQIIEERIARTNVELFLFKEKIKMK